MGVVYSCKYCGKESPEEPLNYEGKVVDFQSFIDRKIDKLSSKCECQYLGSIEVLKRFGIKIDKKTISKYGMMKYNKMLHSKKKRTRKKYEKMFLDLNN